METRAKILIVDDLEENLLALEAILDQPDILLLKATSGQGALELLLEHEIALAILDVQMPVMDGFETAELMRGNKRTREIPIIFVTAISKEERYQFKGYECGAVDYMFKPLKPEVLRGKVRIFIEMHFQKVELREKTATLDRKIAELEAVKEELEIVNRRLEKLSTHDALTNLYNRRAFDEKSAEEFHRSCRNERPLAVLMIDIDYFKNYNDHYGHQQGDRCLIQVADALTRLVNRPGDLLVRYGGEEFLVLLPETDMDGTLHVAESICQAIRDMRIEHLASEIDDCLTVSVGGVSTWPNTGHCIVDLIEAADTALYQAKNQGRNCAIVRKLEL